jgi:hypothetical protein
MYDFLFWVDSGGWLFFGVGIVTVGIKKIQIIFQLKHEYRGTVMNIC